MFFTGDVADVTEADLLDLKGKQDEGERWEFKELWPDNLKIEKSVCAFANTSGGYLIIGVKCAPNSKVSDVPGAQSVPQHNEKVVSISGTIAPRVVPQVREVELSNGKVAVVIYATPSPDVPHMCSDHKYYLRAGRQNTPMAESMVDKLYIARHAAERQVDEFLSEIGWGRRACPGDRWWLSMFAMPLRIDDQLMVNSAEMLGFLRAMGNKIDAMAGAAVANNSYHGFTSTPGFGDGQNYFFELRHNGFLTSGRCVPWIESMRHGRQSVVWDAVARFTVEFLRAAAAVYDRLGYSYFVRIGLLLTDTAGSLLTNNKGILFYDGQEAMGERQLLFTRDRPASDLKEQLLPVSEEFMAWLARSYGLQAYTLETDRPDWHNFLRNLSQQQEQLEIP